MTTDCLVELLVQPVPPVEASSGLPARALVCRDGAACDTDGAADGTCTFAVALCANNVDPRLAGDARRAACQPSTLAGVTASLASLDAALTPLLPIVEEGCAPLPAPIAVKLRPGRTGRRKATLKLKLNATTPAGTVDKDAFTFTCLP
jgi:hypothetical protein